MTEMKSRMCGPSIQLRFFLFCLAAVCAHSSVQAQGIVISTSDLPWATKGEAYDAPIVTHVSGRCPQGDVRLTVASGELPKGLDLFSYGLEGTPRRIGTYQFVLQAKNNCGSAFRSMRLLVTGRPILLVSPRELVIDRIAGSGENADSDGLLKVEASWPELPYTVMPLNTAPWLDVAPVEGRTPDPESAFTGDRVLLRVDASNLAPGVYHAKLKFYADGSENAPVVNVTVKVHKAE
jgi:hypothetical protein